MDEEQAPWQAVPKKTRQPRAQRTYLQVAQTLQPPDPPQQGRWLWQPAPAPWHDQRQQPPSPPPAVRGWVCQACQTWHHNPKLISCRICNQRRDTRANPPRGAPTASGAAQLAGGAQRQVRPPPLRQDGPLQAPKLPAQLRGLFPKKEQEPTEMAVEMESVPATPPPPAEQKEQSLEELEAIRTTLLSAGLQREVLSIDKRIQEAKQRKESAEGSSQVRAKRQFDVADKHAKKCKTVHDMQKSRVADLKEQLLKEESALQEAATNLAEADHALRLTIEAYNAFAAPMPPQPPAVTQTQLLEGWGSLFAKAMQDSNFSQALVKQAYETESTELAKKGEPVPDLVSYVHAASVTHVLQTLQTVIPAVMLAGTVVQPTAAPVAHGPLPPQEGVPTPQTPLQPAVESKPAQRRRKSRSRSESRRGREGSGRSRSRASEGGGSTG